MFLKKPAESLALLKPFLTGRHVWDMGAGETPRIVADILLSSEIGAKYVTSVDASFGRRRSTPNHKTICSDYNLIKGVDDVVLVSWPSAYGVKPGWLKTARVLVFIGANDGCTACYLPGLFTEMAKREVLFHQEASKGGDCLESQDFQVCGDRLSLLRAATAIETRGLDVEQWYSSNRVGKAYE